MRLVLAVRAEHPALGRGHGAGARGGGGAVVGVLFNSLAPFPVIFGMRRGEYDMPRRNGPCPLDPARQR